MYIFTHVFYLSINPIEGLMDLGGSCNKSPPKSWKQMVGNCEKVAGRPEKTIKNHWNTTKGSLLHAYIKKVNVAEEATKECKIEE